MHTTRHRLTATHGVIPLTISFYAASSLAAPQAEALPRAVSDVAISVVTDPATSFVTGCAAGAVIAGLLVSLISHGSKRRLQEQLAEAMDALSRAEAAASAAEQMVHEMQLETGVLNGMPYSPFDYVGTVKLEDSEHFAFEDGDSKSASDAIGLVAGSASVGDPFADAHLDEDTQVYDTARENGFAVAAETVAPEVGHASQTSQTSQKGKRTRSSRPKITGASPARTGAHLRTTVQTTQTTQTTQTAQTAQATKATQTQATTHAPGKKSGLGATGQTMAMRLAERYGRWGDDIVIERAPQVLEDTRPHARGAKSAPTVRYFDPKKRAAAINRRVPRLDASLYPDVSAVSSHDHDPFVTAMRAMDRAMGTQQAAPYESGTTYRGTASRTPHASHQVGSDLGTSRDLGTTRGDLIARATPIVSTENENHVDQLVAEEFAINRSGAPRRYSRSKLTMIDGGDDASAPRRGGRHFANVS